MKKGDRIRLKHPFSPNCNSLRTYNLGIVAAIICDQSKKNITDVLIQLYDPTNDTVYVDGFNTKVLYSFLPHEIEAI